MTHPTPLARALAGRPMAMASRRLDALLAASGLAVSPPCAAPLRHQLVGGIAILPVVGPLVARGDWFSEMLGATTYCDLAHAVADAFADPGSQGVLLEIDSPGGEVGGLFDLIEEILRLKAEVGKPLWAVASEAALSAAYAIASAADRLFVTQTGEIGSVGVVAVHVDESAADAKAGLKWTLVHAGAHKVDGNPHEALSASGLGAIQADVDALHGELVQLVARNRAMTAEAIRATEASVYRGARGVAAGLADDVGTLRQALCAFETILDGSNTSTARRRVAAQPLNQTRSPNAMTEQTNQAAAEGETAENTQPSPALEAPTNTGETNVAETLRAEFAEIASLAAQASRLGITIDAADAMRKGLKPEALRRSILDALAARSDANAIVSTAPSPAAVTGSPIVRRAKERAAAGR
jgi:signal peptide peptidase SppA